MLASIKDTGHFGDLLSIPVLNLCLATYSNSRPCFPINLIDVLMCYDVLISGDVLRLQDVSLKQRYTEPPLHLSESELLALMDRHGIGNLPSKRQFGAIRNVQFEIV